ncbi:lysophosphatidylcholine acyltransferase 1 [Anaeramoeba ignava]|uniref:Lysophosphatidylcholine acyltransferase 1 n=1 Tax=Anaeramoeba ignava TaxID=1746090 RepID=A0A9Q0RCH9_ANAIG|nr:lysophosphatidylcholine acyltransferase 1 [Anaeramoeba ignava]
MTEKESKSKKVEKEEFKEEYKPFTDKKYTTQEKILMIIGFILYGFIRLVICLLLAIIYTLVLKIASLFTEIEKKRKFMKIWTSIVVRMILLSLGFWRIDLIGKDKLRKSIEENIRIYIGNHTSSMDIALSMVLFLPSFAAKKSVQNMFLIGFLSKVFQSVYIDRTKSNFVVIEEIKKRAKETEKPPMAIFPEATTTNGEYLIGFKRGAFNPGTKIQPMIFRYKKGWPFNFIQYEWSLRNGVFHFLDMFCNLFTTVTVEFLDPYEPNQEEKEDSKLFAENVLKYMSQKSGIPISPANFSHKIEYAKKIGTSLK